jgi:hypothetical protein
MQLRLTIFFALWVFPAWLFCQQPDSWKEYVYPQDGVAISAPEEPQFVDGKTDHMYVSFLGNDEKLALMVTTLVGMSDLEVRSVMRDSLTQDKSIEPSSIGEATVVGNPGFRAVRLLGKKRYSVRAVYISGRLIRMEAFEGAEGERFLNSLRMVESEWKEYSYPADGFRVSSPAEPQIKKKDSSITEYTMDVPGGDYVVIHVPARPAADAGAARTALLKFRDHMGETLQGKLTAESVLDSEVPGIAFDYDVPTGVKRVSGRMYYSGAGIYIVMARGKAEPERFLAAFRLTSPAP